jgi:hypothetical protein
VLDVPTVAHLPALLSSSKLKSLTGSENNPIAVVVHFTGRDVLLNEQYKSFMESSFPISTPHLLLNEFCDFPSGSEAVHRLQTKLNLIDPVVFPMLDSDARQEHTNTDRPHLLRDYKVPLILAQTGMKISLRPDINFDQLVHCFISITLAS